MGAGAVCNVEVTVGIHVDPTGIIESGCRSLAVKISGGSASRKIGHHPISCDAVDDIGGCTRHIQHAGGVHHYIIWLTNGHTAGGDGRDFKG